MNAKVRMTPVEALRFARELTAAAIRAQENAKGNPNAYAEATAEVRRTSGARATLEVRIVGAE